MSKPKEVKLFHNTHYSYCYKYLDKEDRLGRDLFKKANKRIFELAAEALYEERDGVLLEGFGYLFNFMTPEPFRNMYNNLIGAMGRKYFTMFRTISGGNPLYDYQISYNAKAQERIKKRVKKGQLYTHQLSLLLDANSIEKRNKEDAV